MSGKETSPGAVYPTIEERIQNEDEFDEIVSDLEKSKKFKRVGNRQFFAGFGLLITGAITEVYFDANVAAVAGIAQQAVGVAGILRGVHNASSGKELRQTVDQKIQKL